MPLPSSGAIDLNSLHRQVGGTSATQCSLNDVDIRSLTGASSGATQSIDSYYGTSPYAVSLIAKDASYGTAGAIATTGAVNSQAAIDIFWRRTGATSAAISVSGYLNNAVSSITRYNTDNTTTTVTANANTYLDLATFNNSASAYDSFDVGYKIVEISESTISGAGSVQRQSTETPAATFNATNNTNVSLTSGQTMGYRETIITSNASNAFRRRYTVDFYLRDVKEYQFILEVHYEP